MATVLQILDPDALWSTETETVLFDLNDPTGAANAYGVKTYYGVGGAFGLGRNQFDATRFEPTARAGGTTLRIRDGLTPSSWRQRISASSVDNLRGGVGALAVLLRQGGVLKWVPDGATMTRYIDFEPSPYPAVLDGTPGELVQAIRRFDTPQGVLIEILRQPWCRSGTLSSDTNKLANPTLLLDVNLDGRPDNWALDATTGVTAESCLTNDAYTYTLATGNTRKLQQSTGAATAAPGDVWSFAFDAFATAGTATVTAVLEFMSAANAVLATATGAGTVVSTATGNPTNRQRVTVTSAAAPASTDHIRVNLQVANTSGANATIGQRNAQAEKAGASSLFVPSTEAVSLDPATGYGRVLPLYVQGDLPAPVRIREKAVTVGLGGLLLARRGTYGRVGYRAIPRYLNGGKFLQCEGGTLGTDTTSVADALASGGNVAQVSFATTAALTKRVTLTITDLTALRGTFGVYLRAKVSAAGSSVGVVMKSAAGVPPDQSFVTEAKVQIDNQITFGDFRVGRVRVTEDQKITTGSLTIQLFAEQTSGAATLSLDAITLVPEDEGVAVASVQPFGDGQAANEFLRFDPAVPELLRLDTTQKVYGGSGSLQGPPFWSDPGLSALYVAGLDRAKGIVGNPANSVTTGNTTTITLTAPANLAPGDIDFVMLSVGNATAPVVISSGWTFIRSDFKGAIVNTYLYAMIAGAHPSNFQATVSAGTSGARFRIPNQVGDLSQLFYGLTANTGTGTSLTAKAVNTLYDNSTVLALYAHAVSQAGTLPGAPWTTLYNYTGGGIGGGLWAVYQNVAAAGATADAVATAATSGNWVAYQISLLPLLQPSTLVTTLARSDPVSVEYEPRWVM